MLSVKKVAKPPFTKPVLILVIALYATATLADISDALQIAQLSDGFNPEQKYMASCFACHSTGAAGAPKVGDGMAVE
ncbi:MAG: cytochrome c, partial [Porticoccaceae bacterium]|nr:cytochrome c [Porticoccaceae bacterium]